MGLGLGLGLGLGSGLGLKGLKGLGLDGRKSGAYCQNLCYMAKLFLDHKVGWVGD